MVVEAREGYELTELTYNGNPISIDDIDNISFIMPMGDVEVEATFTPIKYRINYVLDGGENSSDNPEYYTTDDDYIELAEAHKDGYNFLGWCLDEERTQYVYSVPTYTREDITLYASFEQIYDYGEEE